jgi:hypothetical protein
LTLAARYLELFEVESRARDMELYACAGIAVVKAHYPFARAYELSQALTGKAKKYARAEADGNLSALDWHFAAGGLLGELKDIREREYTVPAGDLNLRPLPLRETGWHSWPAIKRVVGEFLDKEGKWYGHRNKVIALRETLREGPEATRIFLEGLDEDLPTLDPANEAWQKTGWVGGECGYFDAIEALDFYVPLSKDEEVNDAEV